MARKSLGTLTLDLIAKVSGFEQGMDKASRKSQKTAKQIERHANQIGKSLAAGTAAAVTGMAALVASTAEGAREVQNLSRLAGSSPQDFQKFTYAAKRFGVEQDKVSDILKDTNDRIGDFIQTGGGPMADFFENIAPKVGVTADEFARLSGPEALQLYVKSLEDAGASQQEMTFYMEAIASDATALIPLLRDDGREMRRLGDEAERTGNVLSDMEFEQLESVRRGMDELSGAAKGMSNQVVMAALPAINDLIDLLSDEDTLRSAQALGSAVVTAMNKTVQAIDGAVKITQFLAEELAAMTAGAAADDIVRLQDELDVLQGMLENPTTRLRFFGKDGVVEFYDEAEIRQMIAETKGKIADAQKQLENEARNRPAINLVDDPSLPQVGGGGWNGAGTGTGKPDRDAAEEAAEKAADLMRDYRGLVRDLQTEEEQLSSQLRERLELLDAVGVATDQDYSRAAAGAFQDAPDVSGLSPEIGGAFGELNKIDEEQERLEEWYSTQLEMLAGYREQRADLSEQWNEQERQLEQEHQDKLLQIESARQQAQLAAAESLFGNLADVTATFAGEQSALYKTMFAVQKAAAIAQSIVAIQSGIAQAAANPWPANLAAMASVAAATAGIVSNIQSVALTGMAHDGIDSVPREGTWLLDKGERVLSNPQAENLDAFLASQKGGGGNGGAPIVNINENPDKAGAVNARQNDDGQWVIDVMVADAMGGGRFSRTNESVYGLRRQGR